MWYLLHLTLRALWYLIAGCFLAAFFVGLLLFTLLRVTVVASWRLSQHLARRPGPGGDESAGDLPVGEREPAVVDAYRGGVDDDLSPVLHRYLVSH